MPNISTELASALDAMQTAITLAEEKLSRLPMANETSLEFPCDQDDSRNDRLLFVDERLQLVGVSTSNHYRPLAELPIALRLKCCKMFPEFFELVRNRASELPQEVLETVAQMNQSMACVSD